MMGFGSMVHKMGALNKNKTLSSSFVFVAILLAWGFFTLAFSADASALSSPPTGIMPDHIYNYFLPCDGYSKNPSYRSWVSPAGDTSSSVVAVNYDADYVDLKFNFIGMNCWDNNTVSAAKSHITSIFWREAGQPDQSPAGVVNGVSVGDTHLISYQPNYWQKNSYGMDSITVRFNPPGRFTEEKSYVVGFDAKSINQWSGGSAHQCIGGTEGEADHLDDIDDCDPALADFDFKVIVNNIPTYWEYHPRIDPVTPLSYRPKPGEKVTADGHIDNVRSGTGKGFSKCVDVIIMPPSFNGTDVIADNNPGWSSGGPGSPTECVTGGPVPGHSSAGYSSNGVGTEYQIPAGTLHDSKVCFRTTANPWFGQSTPDLTTMWPGDLWIMTSGSHAHSETLCYTVFNQGFSLDGLDLSSNKTIVHPGEEFVLTALYYNDADIDEIRAFTGDPATSQGRAVGISHIPDIPTSPTPDITFKNSNMPSWPTEVEVGNDNARRFRYSVGTGVLPGEYCFNITVSPKVGWSDGSGSTGSMRAEQFCITVQDFRYVKVYGSDVWAGGTFSSYSECTDVASSPSASGAITSHRANHIGSSAEYGAVAILDRISGFASAVRGDWGVSFSPESDWLSFENRDRLGHFSPGKCISNLYDQLYSPEIASAGGEILDGAYSEPQLRHLNTNSIPAKTGISNRVVLLYEGDLNIDGNIEYATDYPVSNGVAQIPSVVVIVKDGNINISNDVTRLDGLYMAIPDENGNGGNINTCYNGSCDTYQLVINGSFVAKYVDFNRTSGGYKEALLTCNAGDCEQETNASEVFKFSPELYLANPFEGLINATDSIGGVETYTELPPVF